jgi:hypothetical protein
MTSWNTHCSDSTHPWTLSMPCHPAFNFQRRANDHRLSLIIPYAFYHLYSSLFPMFSSIEFPICFRSLLSNGCVGHVLHGTALGIAPGTAYYDTDEGQRERATWIYLTTRRISGTRRWIYPLETMSVLLFGELGNRALDSAASQE